MSEFAFKFSPSLLQAYNDYIDSEALYEKFYGFSEEPPLTYQEFEDKQFRELIDKINRKPFTSEAADRGSCVNEIVDCIVLGRRSTRDDIVVKTITSHEQAMSVAECDDDDRPKYCTYWFNAIKQPCIYARKGDFEFYFDIAFCREVGAYFKDSLCQIYTEAPIETKHGKVLLYGYPDYVRGDMVYDLKTTSKYEFGKYAKYWQQHLYPWALTESGKCSDIRAFEFTAYAMKGGTKNVPLLYGEKFPELYVYDHERSGRMLRGICESFGDFLIEHRSLITDAKIFGGDKKL